MRWVRSVSVGVATVLVAGCTSAGSRPARTAASTGAMPVTASVGPPRSSAMPAPVPPATAPTTPPPTSPTTRPTTPTSTATRPAQRAVVAPVSAAARADGLVDVRSLVPDAVIDLRYATRHNFTGVRLYPRDARCLVHRSMAAGLVVAARDLRRAGDVLVFWDCYRPHAVQVRMYQVVPNPNWVARPGPYARSHESGRSVDVTLARATTGRRLDMGTGFDDFTPRAYAFATEGVSAKAQADRARLRRAMNAGGLNVYSGEWWHFDGPGSDVHRPILTAPVD